MRRCRSIPPTPEPSTDGTAPPSPSGSAADSSSCTSSVLLLIGARLAWRRGLAHNRLKKFERAKSDLKRACVPLHLPSNLCRVWCRNTR